MTFLEALTTGKLIRPVGGVYTFDTPAGWLESADLNDNHAWTFYGDWEAQDAKQELLDLRQPLIETIIKNLQKDIT